MQEKMEEGLRHLERIAQLKEPEDSKNKAHYYDGIFLISMYEADTTIPIFVKNEVKNFNTLMGVTWIPF